MSRGFALALAIGVAISGCVVDPVDLTEKRCPCAAPAVCDPMTDRCVSGPDGCEPQARAQDFRGAWATPHQIRWEWSPVGDREAFVRYEVEIAEDPSDLGTDAARIVGSSENPELGGYVLPRTGGADDIVTFTVTGSHEPETTYVARLLVTDTSFCTFRSEMAAISTTLEPAPSERVVLYEGPAPDPGFSFPSGLRIVDDGAGGMATEHVPSLDAECIESGEGVCSQNIRWSGMAIGATDISEGELANLAYLEIRLTTDVDLPSFYSRFWLQTSGGGIYRIEPFTIPPAPGGRIYEVPLRELRDGEQALDQPTLQAETITEVNVGGQWSRCASDEEETPCTRGRVLLHSAVIRY